MLIYNTNFLKHNRINIQNQYTKINCFSIYQESLTRTKLVFKNPFHDSFTNVFSNASSERDEMFHKLLEKSSKTLRDLKASCAHRLAELVCFITNRDVQNRCNLHQSSSKIFY